MPRAAGSPCAPSRRFPGCRLPVPLGFSEPIRQVRPPRAAFPHPKSFSKRGFSRVTVAESWLLQPRGSVPVPACHRRLCLFAVTCSFLTNTGKTPSRGSAPGGGFVAFPLPSPPPGPLCPPQLPARLLPQVQLDPGFYPQGSVILGSVLSLAGPGVFLRGETAMWGQREEKSPYSLPGKSRCGRDVQLRAWEAPKAKGWVCGVML